MASDRVQRQIDHLLDEAEEALSQHNWAVARDRAQTILAIDPGNNDAVTYLAAAERALDPPSISPIPQEAEEVQSGRE